MVDIAAKSRDFWAQDSLNWDEEERKDVLEFLRELIKAVESGDKEVCYVAVIKDPNTRLIVKQAEAHATPDTIAGFLEMSDRLKAKFAIKLLKIFAIKLPKIFGGEINGEDG